jgi:hypothetical protein
VTNLAKGRRWAFGPAAFGTAHQINGFVAQAARRLRIAEGFVTMHDEMSDLVPALLAAVVVAVGLVAFQFHAVASAKPAQAVEARVEKPKAEKPAEKPKADKIAQVAMNDRLYWIR